MNYKRIYKLLIKKVRDRKVAPPVVERHHIRPRCLGGSNSPRNLALLTPEEHYVAHQLLVKLHPKNRKLIWAALTMTGTGNGKGNGRGGNKLYGWLKRKFIEEQTNKPLPEKTRAKISKKIKAWLSDPTNHPLWGKKHSKKAKARMSAAQKEAFKSGKRKPTVVTHTEETKALLRQIQLEGHRSGKFKTRKGQKQSKQCRARMRAHWKAVREGVFGEERRIAWLASLRERGLKGSAVRIARMEAQITPPLN